MATQDADGLQIHQYMDATLPGVRMRTRYPWAGAVELEVTEPGERTLALRVPAWGAARLDGKPVAPGYVRVRRDWRAGDRLVLELDMTPRLVAPHPRIDAVRGCVALARGPLVYCVEQADHPGIAVEDLRIDPAAPPAPAGGNPGLGVPVIISGRATVATGAPAELYAPHQPQDAVPATVTAIPYFRWANRGPNAMRVWIPAAVNAPR